MNAVPEPMSQPTRIGGGTTPVRFALLSALVAGLFALSAGGQDAKDKTKKAEPAKPLEGDLRFEATYVLADPKPPAKGSLEEAIARAMQHNPDVRVAEAEAQLAQAKLSQVRAKVAQQVSAARAAVDDAKRGVQAAEAEMQATGAATRIAEGELERLKVVRVNAGISQQEFAQAEAKLMVEKMQMMKAATRVEAAKAAVANAEAALNGLLGTVPGQTVPYSVQLRTGSIKVSDGVLGSAAFSPAVDVVTFGSEWVVVDQSGPTAIFRSGPTAAPPGSVADRLKAALDKPVTFRQPADAPTIGGVVEALKAQAGLDFPIRLALSRKESWEKLNLPPDTLPLGAWLQQIEDQLPTVKFVLREYGVLVTDANNLPQDAQPVQAFWKRVRAEKAAAEKAAADKKAAPAARP